MSFDTTKAIGSAAETPTGAAIGKGIGRPTGQGIGDAEGPPMVGTDGYGTAAAYGASEAFPRMYAKTRRFSVGVPRNVTLINGGGVLFLRSKDGDNPVLCLWLAERDARTGVWSERIIVDPATMTMGFGDELPAAERARRERARESGAGIVSYSTNPAGSTVCFSLGGSLFIVETATGEVTVPSLSDTVFDPRISPDGRHIAFVSGNELRVASVTDEVEPPRWDASTVAGGGGPQVSYGRAEFIAAEEMQRSRGFWWSPNSDRLLVTRVDETPVSSWWIADPAHPERAPNEVRYPVAGSANAQLDLLMVDLDGGRSAIQWDDDGDYEYLANVIWRNGHEPVIVRQTRNQRDVSIATLDPDSLNVTERHRIADETWVELIPSSPTLSDHGMLTIEDIPGHRALLRDGVPVTGDHLNVRSIVGVIGHHAMITAWTEPTEIHLFMIDLTDGGGTPTRMTTTPGVYGAVLGRGTTDATEDDELLAVVTSARPAADGVEVAVRPITLQTEPALGAPLTFVEDVSHRPPITAAPLFCQLGADRLESALFLPSGYQGDDPLPVLLDPYGGPHAQRVLKNQTSHLVSQWFADQGFAVLVTDGRGTPGRGPEWERQVWGDLATCVLEDQLAALDAAAEDYGVLDLSRVAIRGWSFGGYLAALAVIRRPDRFHSAVAGAPVTTWRLYDTHYTERYLGQPDLYPRHYETTDLTAEAAELRRPLLLIHGLADDNVVAAHTLQLSSALLGAAVPHRVLPLSGVTHMTPQEVVAENLLWLQLDFIRESLGILGTDHGAGQEADNPSPAMS